MPCTGSHGANRTMMERDGHAVAPKRGRRLRSGYSYDFFLDSHAPRRYI
jgi:hypothetical protein